MDWDAIEPLWLEYAAGEDAYAHFFSADYENVVVRWRSLPEFAQ